MKNRCLRLMYSVVLVLSLTFCIAACSSGSDVPETTEAAKPADLFKEETTKEAEEVVDETTEEKEETVVTTEAEQPEDTEEITTEAVIEPDTTEAVTAAETAMEETTEVQNSQVTYSDGVYKVRIPRDNFYESNGTLYVKAGRLENVYLNDTFVQYINIGTHIDLSEYGLETIVVEDNIEFYDDFIELDYTYYLEPLNDGTGRWMILEVNDLPMCYVAEWMDVPFAEGIEIVDYAMYEKVIWEDPRGFFEKYESIEQWPVTMEIKDGRIVNFEFEYRP